MPLLNKGNQPNNFNNQAGTSTQRIRLRRVPTKQEIIKKNLSNVHQNVLKKKVAQEYYYSQKKTNGGRSPLKRQGTITNQSSIQNRIGLNTTRIFTNKNQRRNNQNQNNLKTSGNQNIPFARKKRMNNVQAGQKVMMRNNVTNNRMQRFTKKQSAQQRLIQIRQNVKTNNTQVLQNKIKLRRPQLMNYKIQVSPQQRMLNPRLQAEIKAIQSRAPPAEALPTTQTPQPTSTFGVTGLTLNERFSELM